MKKKLILPVRYAMLMIGLIMLMAFTSTTAEGKRQATATPTWDIRTPPNTPNGTPNVGAMFPTVTATQNMACPVGTIVGYGTLTPGLPWSLACGQCLPTSTVLPTLNMNDLIATNLARQGTVTPGYGSTNTPTATATATRTNTPTATATSGQIKWTGVATTGGSTLPSHTETCSIASNTLTNSFYCDFAFSATDTNGILDMWVDTSVTVQQSVTGMTVYVYRDFVNTNGDVTLANNYTSPLTSPYLQTLTGLNTAAVGRDTFWHVGHAGSATGSFSGTMRITFSTTSVQPTPTTIVTTTPTNYCGTIDNGSYDYKNWFKIMSLTGSSQCFSTPYISAADFLGSGWIAFFSFIFPQGVTDFIANAVVPAQTWCFYGVGFTPWNLFGIVVDPTIFADLVIFLFVLYHFITK